jgi:hypothetical protein
VKASWVAGAVRARLLADRRLGRERALEVGTAESLPTAVALLTGSRFGFDSHPEATRAEIERAIAASLLLELRILAGWLPRTALELMRALAAWFELANIEERLTYLKGAQLRPPFALGALGVAWTRAGSSQTPAEVREALAASLWGDPGGDTPATVHRWLRLAWARRLADEAPEAREWIAGAVALFVANDLSSAVEPGDRARRIVSRFLGSGWEQARTLEQLAAVLPPSAAWPLTEVSGSEDLWRAEVRWWDRLEHDAEAMLRRPRDARAVVIGAIALLAADARWATAAIEAAARGAADELEEMIRVAG